MNDGLFIPEHFHSREQKVHSDNFRETFVLRNICSLELSPLWNFRSSGTNVPQLLLCGNFVLENEYSKNFCSKCTKKTFYKCHNKPHNSLLAIISRMHWFLATDLWHWHNGALWNNFLDVPLAQTPSNFAPEHCLWEATSRTSGVKTL